MGNITFVGISGSLRKASRNSGLLRCCAANLPKGVSLEIADISALPFYNADMEKPAAVQQLVDQVSAAHGLVLACPEYNYSLAPALKNALDWLSREPDLAPLTGKTACIVGADPQAGIYMAVLCSGEVDRAEDLLAALRGGSNPAMLPLRHAVRGSIEPRFLPAAQ